ncbi:uncharacterized protein LOC111452211 [Cucurbita moschata]|uniref:Uncharacterized protein LOC111452211 n=1 Tax=Cucurbita moschata TaxID=3662 RepID=A0A6J1G9P3_CUCMO|nr:uncharacterized protein LOC111452211 [Cucurbita moschata]
MKLLLPSPSCSSTSSFSTSNFDPHVCNPRAAAATPSCLSGILRRILCSGSLPTHPSDQTTEETSSLKSEDNVKNVGVMKDTNGGIEAKPTAGIVARLMGLDTMPDMKQNCNSIARTQSMNSVEHFYKHLEGRHKGARSTQSFREIPTFLELENEDYFILSFEGDSKNEELKAKARRHGEEKCKNRGSNKTEHSYVRKTKKKIFNPEEANEFVLIDLKQKKKSRKRVSRNKPTSRISTKDRHGRRSTRKVESERSDELSPVSVLDSSEFLRDSEEAAPLSGDAASKSPVNSRRKLSPELEISQRSSRNDDDLIIKEGNPAKTKAIEEEICKITEMELGKSNWNYRKFCEEHEELGVESIIEGFDSFILEGLIEEFAEQMYDSIFI